MKSMSIKESKGTARRLSVFHCIKASADLSDNEEEKRLYPIQQLDSSISFCGPVISFGVGPPFSKQYMR